MVKKYLRLAIVSIIMCMVCTAFSASIIPSKLPLRINAYAAATTVKIGHAVSGDRGLKGNKAGDQSGREVLIEDWDYSIFSFSRYHWKYVLRPKDHDLARALAARMKETCSNDKIGYDQNRPDQTTFFDEAEAANWYISDVKNKCETTCSNAISVCLNAEGVQVPKSWNTSRMKKDLMDSGFFECKSSIKYVQSSKLLVPGDILLYPGKHAAVVVESDNPYTYKVIYTTEDGKTRKAEIEEGTYIQINPNNGEKTEALQIDMDKNLSEIECALINHKMIGWRKDPNNTFIACYKSERWTMKLNTEKINL